MTKVENFNIGENGLRVLVAPLDWGLGHATRCIPVILKLINMGCTVIIAAEGPSLQLLKKEFPQLQFLHLDGYRISYSSKKNWLPLKMVLQVPKICFRIFQEHQWLKKVVKRYKLNAVISDNRFGMYHRSIPSIYITHQLLIKTGRPFTENLLQKIHYWFINRFTTCWVPDTEGKNNLAGDLSHPAMMPTIPVIYTGPLTRFTKATTEIKYSLCIILSGPEPQRSIFEQLVISQLDNFSKPVLVVRGLPSEIKNIRSVNPLIEIVNHLPATELNRALLQSELVICRSGYSTIMDLAALEKTAVLVPTPGQTEQEYLAAYLQKKNLFYSRNQADFLLYEALKITGELQNENFAAGKTNLLNAIVEDFVSQLNKVSNASA